LNGHPPLIGSGVGEARLLARGRVLVLNATYEPLNVCTVRRALVLILKQKAEVLENGDGVLRSETMRLDMPEVIRLVSFVRVPRDIHRRRITRKAVLARDGWVCQYCGTERPGLTVDHVIPRSRGGESVWENIVASCAACNRRKGNRMPHEIRMHPRNRPRPPGPTVFIRIAAPRTPTAWEPYLPTA
jgi:5-methylcytosine-specific restriction endonuclease McrA